MATSRWDEGQLSHRKQMKCKKFPIRGAIVGGVAKLSSSWLVTYHVDRYHMLFDVLHVDMDHATHVSAIWRKNKFQLGSTWLSISEHTFLSKRNRCEWTLQQSLWRRKADSRTPESGKPKKISSDETTARAKGRGHVRMRKAHRHPARTYARLVPQTLL